MEGEGPYLEWDAVKWLMDTKYEFEEVVRLRAMQLARERRCDVTVEIAREAAESIWESRPFWLTQ